MHPWLFPPRHEAGHAAPQQVVHGNRDLCLVRHRVRELCPVANWVREHRSEFERPGNLGRRYREAIGRLLDADRRLLVRQRKLICPRREREAAACVVCLEAHVYGKRNPLHLDAVAGGARLSGPGRIDRGSRVAACEADVKNVAGRYRGALKPTPLFCA